MFRELLNATLQSPLFVQSGNSIQRRTKRPKCTLLRGYHVAGVHAASYISAYVYGLDALHVYRLSGSTAYLQNLIGCVWVAQCMVKKVGIPFLSVCRLSKANNSIWSKMLNSPTIKTGRIFIGWVYTLWIVEGSVTSVGEYPSEIHNRWK